MTILIPLSATGSRHDNIELRYALRSLCMHQPRDKVIISGALPEWIRNVEHVPYPDAVRPKFREKNILDKIDAALTDEAIVMHDDHFLLAPVTPMQYCGDCIFKRASLSHHNPYKRTVSNTAEIAGWKHGWYDIHAPFHVTRHGLDKVKRYDWSKPYGYGLKTLYAYANGIQGSQYPDLKIIDDLNVYGRKWFSIDDRSFDYGIVDLLERLYPKMSKYET